MLSVKGIYGDTLCEAGQKKAIDASSSECITFHCAKTGTCKWLKELFLRYRSIKFHDPIPFSAVGILMPRTLPYR